MQSVPGCLKESTRATNRTGGRQGEPCIAGKGGGKGGSVAVFGLNTDLDVQRHNLRAWTRETFKLNLKLGPGLQELRTGVILCKIAGMIELAHTKASIAEGKPWKPMRIKLNEQATVGSFFAKDNINRFLVWCGRYIDEAYHFKLDDLSGNAGRDGAVLTCLAELARCDCVASTPLDIIEKQILEETYQPDAAAIAAVVDLLPNAQGLSIETSLGNGVFQLKGDARAVHLAVVNDAPVVCPQQAATASPFPWMTIHAFASAPPAKPRPSVARVLQSLEPQPACGAEKPAPPPRSAKPKIMRLSGDGGAGTSTPRAAPAPLQKHNKEASPYCVHQEQMTTASMGTGEGISQPSTETTTTERSGASVSGEHQTSADTQSSHGSGCETQNRTHDAGGDRDEDCHGSLSTEANAAGDASSDSDNTDDDDDILSKSMSEAVTRSSPLSRASSSGNDTLSQRRPLPLPKARRSVAFDNGATPRSRKTSLATVLSASAPDRAPSRGAQRTLPASTPSTASFGRTPSSGRPSWFSTTAVSSASGTPTASQQPSLTNLLSKTPSNSRRAVLPVPRKLRQQASNQQLQDDSNLDIAPTDPTAAAANRFGSGGDMETTCAPTEPTTAEELSNQPADKQPQPEPLTDKSDASTTQPAIITMTQAELEERMEAYADLKLKAMARDHQLALEGLQQERDDYARRLAALEEAAEEVETTYDAKLKELQQERDDAHKTAHRLQEEVAALRKDLTAGRNEGDARAGELEQGLASLKKMQQQHHHHHHHQQQQQQQSTAREGGDEVSSASTPLTPNYGSATEPVFFSRLKNSFKASCDDMLRSLGPHNESAAKKVHQLEEALATAEEEFQAEKAASGFRMAVLSSQVYSLEQDKRSLEEKLTLMRGTITNAVQQLLPLSTVNACKHHPESSPADKRRSVQMHPATML